MDNIEENKQQDNTSTWLLPFTLFPYKLISAELAGVYGNDVLKDLGEIIKLYDVYDQGADFTTDRTKDYIPAQLKYKKSSELINKEARFLFSNPPDINVAVKGEGTSDQEIEAAKAQNTILQDFLDSVLDKNKFSEKLLKAAKDCFIGKRIAIFANFNSKGIQVSFAPSLEFIYDVDPTDIDVITKIVAFFTVKDSESASEKRIYKKKYWMENGFCHIVEELYDGTATLVETITPELTTKFTYIPAVIILNDGLSGDLKGRSDIAQLMNYESWYSRLANSDMDAERKSMNPTRYVMDCSEESTKNLSLAAGALWDLQTDQNAAQTMTGKAGILESNMGYSSALTTTLGRLKDTMHDTLDVPDVSTSALKGVVTSGKSLRAIYWGLIVRCDEKMLVWRPALQNLMRIIIEGAKLYPESAKFYSTDKLPDVKYNITVDNQYPIPEDEAEEKQTDLAEVTAQTMSKKYYMKKWYGMTDEEADNELDQIVLEQQLIDSASGITPPTDESDVTQPEEEETQPEEEATNTTESESNNQGVNAPQNSSEETPKAGE